MTMRDWLALDYYITDADQLVGLPVYQFLGWAAVCAQCDTVTEAAL